jgi:hypothetical protein
MRARRFCVASNLHEQAHLGDTHLVLLDFTASFEQALQAL